MRTVEALFESEVSRGGDFQPQNARPGGGHERKAGTRASEPSRKHLLRAGVPGASLSAP